MALKRGKKKSSSEKDVNVNIKLDNKTKLKHGGGGFWMFGSALAMIISYSQNTSIGWAILHGIFSWIYVIYHAIVF
jgi:hypothetical protein